MKTTIIKFGNSKGIRLPKAVLALSGLDNNVELEVKPGEITIRAAKEESINIIAQASESAFAKDWLRPEEDGAWASYQLEQ
jgi:antitoxin component of MazEF toxin-antitoxin module